MRRFLAAALFIGALCGNAAAEELSIDAAYLLRDSESLQPLSPVEEPPDNLGVAGARLGISDNATTGAFLKHTYALTVLVFAADEAINLPDEMGLYIADLPGEDLRAAAAARPDALFINVRSEDDFWRAEECPANIFHTAASRAMKADALAQYLVWKQWRRWFLVHGALPADMAWADALRRAAEKFGADIVEERVYAYEATTRRTDSGHMQIQRQLPVFTQDAEEHDVLIAADESEVFAAYLPYRIWSPRPVAGSAGLRPQLWQAASEQWGATQLQRRFIKISDRRMLERDYAAWIAIRAIGEAVTRAQTADVAALKAYMQSDEFSVAGFKGQPLTFRKWNRQLRQPIFVGDARMVVSVSPQPTFLHERTPLDSLGFDSPESACRAGVLQ